MLYIVDVLVTLVALFTLRTMVATTTALVDAGAHWYSSVSGYFILQLGTQEEVAFDEKVKLLLDEGGVRVAVTLTVFVLVT